MTGLYRLLNAAGSAIAMAIATKIAAFGVRCEMRARGPPR